MKKLLTLGIALAVLSAPAAAQSDAMVESSYALAASARALAAQAPMLARLASLEGLASLAEVGRVGYVGRVGRYTLAGPGGARGVAAHRAPPAPWAQADPADSLYRLARRALNDEDYGQAAELFRLIVQRYPKSEYAGDALYWQAYSLYHYSRSGGSRRSIDEAVAAIDRQQRDYPKARTVADAKELRTRLLAAKAQRGDGEAAAQLEQTAKGLAGARGCPSDDEDVRLAALQGLMQMDAESAVPILKQVLARRGECTEQLRKSAVFILSQKRSDEAMRILLDVARSDPSAEVRADAIQWLGQSRSELAAAALDSILFSSRDGEVREKALFALSQQGGDRGTAALRRFALDEKIDPDLRAKAVFWLGQGRARDENGQFFIDLFRKSNNEQIRESVIQAMGNSGAEGQKWLIEVARDKSFPVETRKNALFWAGQRRGDINLLVNLYDQMRPERELQNQVLFVLSQRREKEATDKLMDVAAKEQDRELRKQAIFWLGQKKDPRVAQFLLDLINK